MSQRLHYLGGRAADATTLRTTLRGRSEETRSDGQGHRIWGNPKIADIVAEYRPTPIREYDQIPMWSSHLASQAASVTPLVADKCIAFVGDMDGAASYLGIQASLGFPGPRRMLLLDFDERVLDAAYTIAKRFGYTDMLELVTYNVFDPLPDRLHGSAEWFYTNPPYGSRNKGASARLFIARGCELTGSLNGHGCLILPNQDSRPWTRIAMATTVEFLRNHGWEVVDETIDVHRYFLDDDPDLRSSTVIVRQIPNLLTKPMLYSGRGVSVHEIPDFYGRSTVPPFPRYIGIDGMPLGDVAA